MPVVRCMAVASSRHPRYKPDDIVKYSRYIVATCPMQLEGQLLPLEEANANTVYHEIATVHLDQRTCAASPTKQRVKSIAAAL